MSDDIRTGAMAALIAASADPRAVDAEIAALGDAQPDATAAVLETDVGRSNLTVLAAGSRSLIRWLRTHPDMLAALASERILGPLPGRDRLVDLALETVSEAPGPEDALRRFRRSWFLQLALRDLHGLATLEEAGRSLSDLADACLHAALTIATGGAPDRMCVIGMGKLGGRELNYSSDVDVMFVSPDSEDVTGCARRLLDVMGTHSAEGIVWRTDADLRPEGRSGKLVRSVAGYVSYWERWADTWEFQALIKHRPSAGNETTGIQFSADADRFIWPDSLKPDALDELRAMKARAEDLVARGGSAEREVKLGPGGIRDVEFAVQLLQLVHGRRDASIRSPNTLAALAQLAQAGYIAHGDADILASSYIKLRTVEHRLQLWDEKQVHTLPTDEASLDRLARILGYRATPESSAAAAFWDDFRRDLQTVRSVHERLFYRPLLEVFASQGADTAISSEAAEERLHAFGFTDSKATRRALTSLTSGMSRRSRLMEQTLPLVLGWLTDAPQPDLGLLILERLTEDRHRAETLTSVFRESPLAAQRLCKVIATSRPLGEAVERFPDLIRLLEEEEQLAATRDAEALFDGAMRQLSWREDDSGRLRGLRRFVQRERARIGIREVLGFVDADGAGEEMARLADACLEAALRTSGIHGPEIPDVAIIGMGRLGGRELSYSSDLDIMVVFSDDRGGYGDVERVVQELLRTVSSSTADGTAFDLDLDLRPEGKNGVLARTLSGYVQYWERWAETWEFQALVRARPVAGNVELGEEFMAAAAEHTYRKPFPAAWLTDVRRMKARIDKERLPKGTDSALHLKLGKGGLVDVEFAVQLLQLQRGGDHPEVRCAATREALAALTRADALDLDSAERLDSAYAFASRIRNRLWLMGQQNTDSLPANYDVLGRLARSLGYVHHPAPSLREDWRRVARRAHQAAEAVLYPEDAAET